MPSVGTRRRVDWLISYMTRYLHCIVSGDRTCSIAAWDADTVDAFVEAFPEAEKTLIVYTVGPNSSPMLNATAKAAEKMGFLRAGSMGNQDAKYYGQKTWCRVWTLTPKGLERYEVLRKIKLAAAEKSSCPT